MKECKFCHSTMICENDKVSQRSRYLRTCVCPNCSAVFECEYEEQKAGQRKVIRSRWWNPATKEFENN